MKIQVFGTMEEVIRIYPGDDERCVVEVMCDGDRHKILVDHQGKVAMPDHEDDQATLSDLGDDDEPCTSGDAGPNTCSRVRKQLKKWIKAGYFEC